MSTLNRVLTHFFSGHPFVQQHGPLIMAVSGGRDSLCLLHWLTHAEIITAKVIAITIDHGLRPESAAEYNRVKQMAVGWGAECQIKQTLLTPQTFTENSGRIVRYNILKDAARQAGANFILTGHHVGDQAESVLLHLLRGSGLNGLTGMQTQTLLKESEDQAVTLVRPMLKATHALLDVYATKHHLQPLRDPSNKDLKFTRNRIRHTLMPLLETEFNPQIQNSLSQMATILHDDYLALEQLHLARWEQAERDQGLGWGTFDFNSWQSGNRSFQRFALRRLYEHVRGSMVDLTQENLEVSRLGLIRQRTDKRYQLSGSVWVQKVYDTLLAYHLSAAELFNMPQLAKPTSDLIVSAKQASTVSLNNGQWQLRLCPVKPTELDLQESADNRWVAFIALANQDATLILRGRQMSEAFRPFNMNGDVYLKKLMIDRKIPAILRDRWPLVADETGILWVAGHRLAQRAAITTETRFAVKIILENMMRG